MKFPKSKPAEVALHYTEVFNGRQTQKSFKTDKKTAEGHLQLMKNNPYVRDVRMVKA